MPQPKNLLLEGLPEVDRQALSPHLTAIELKQHDLLFDVHGLVDAVHFLTDGVVSLVLPLSTGEIVETAIVGRDDVVGGAAALNRRASLSRGIVQIGGGFLRCPIEPFKAVVREHAQIGYLLSAHQEALFAQAQQSAACNATHIIEAGSVGGC